MPRTKTYRGWGHIRQLPNKSKRWQASFIGPDCKRHYAPTTFTQKMDAESWLIKERRFIERAAEQDEKWISPSQRAALNQIPRETLSEYGKQWIAQRNIKPRTRIHYSSLLSDHISPVLGEIGVSNLKPATVRSWYATTLIDRPTLRAHAYQLLHAILGTAVKDGLLQANPAQIDGATRIKRASQSVIPDVDELARIADLIQPQRFKALILISAWCGLRWGEVTELHRKDIGEGCEIISIARGAVHREGCHIDTPKSGKPRTVVVPPHIRADIKHHLDTFVAEDVESQLFPPIRGGCHLSDKVIRDALAPAQAKAMGGKRFRIHDLRHFSGTQVARVGNLVETMNHLGHSTVTASLRYQHVVSGRDVEIANQLSALALVSSNDEDGDEESTAFLGR